MDQQIVGNLPGATTNPAPTIACYLPAAEKRSGVGLVILPGGGYRTLADHEGKGYADYFVQAGISCFVVTYRLGAEGHRHPAMVEDALAAVDALPETAHVIGVALNYQKRSRAESYYYYYGRDDSSSGSTPSSNGAGRSFGQKVRKLAPGNVNAEA